MPQLRFFGAWFCLLLWGGVHALQMQHVVEHHLLASGGYDACHHHCHHHHHEPVPVEPLGIPEKPGVVPTDDCPICNWTGVPAMQDLVCSKTALGAEWPICNTLGERQCGCLPPVLGAGIGWRGPPGPDQV